MFLQTKTVTRTATITSLLTIGSLLFIDAAQAFTVTLENAGFETTDLTSWNKIGDAAANGTFTTVVPYAPNYQGVVTTACPSGTPSGECVDTSGVSTSRNDDSPTTTGAYNVSGIEPVSASVEIGSLQTFLGLSADTLQIARENGTITGTRTPKEGSAISQTFTADGSFTLTFNWNYLTNDGNNTRFGDQDFGFVTIYDTSSDISTRDITVLSDSSGSITTPGGTEYTTEGTYAPYTFSETFPAGTYNIGFGVVDVDGVDRSSALLIDEVLVQEIPFEFSPTLGLILSGGIFSGLYYFKKRSKIFLTVKSKKPTFMSYIPWG